ncbi:hypothetical protein TPCV4_16180 [Cutibacterium avidum]|nr:hypothetical protein TPCV4_16180 [Cutibacterium avidum]
MDRQDRRCGPVGQVQAQHEHVRPRQQDCDAHDQVRAMAQVGEKLAHVVSHVTSQMPARLP